MAARVFFSTLFVVLVGIVTPTWGKEWKPGPVTVSSAVPEKIAFYRCRADGVFRRTWRCEPQQPAQTTQTPNGNPVVWVCRDRAGAIVYMGNDPDAFFVGACPGQIIP